MFCAFVGDYLIRYFRAQARREVPVESHGGSSSGKLGGVKGVGMERVKLFFGLFVLRWC